ncbi:hypothetical protein PENTCL1PPCAC_22466, partial [Pristionchus entomophagus]
FSVNKMSQAAVESPAATDLKEYFGLDSDDSDESVDESPSIPTLADKINDDVPECLSSKSSSGVSESSFSSSDSNEIVTTKRRPPATRISLSEKNNFDIAPLGPFLTEEELLADGDDFLDGAIDSDDEDRLLDSLDEANGAVDDDLGFHEVSPLKRERVEVGDVLSDNSVGVSPKRARFDAVETGESLEVEVVEEEEIEDVRDSSALSENASERGLSSFIILGEESNVTNAIWVEEVISPCALDEGDEDSFDVGGVQWNFSSRCAEYLTSAVFVNDIYRVISARENGCEPEIFEDRPEDIDDSLRKQFIDTLLSRKEQLKISLTCVHLSIRLLDNFIHGHACDRKAFIGICIVAVVMASKMEEYESCRFSQVARVIFPFEEEVEVTTLKKLEKTFYSCVDFNVDTPTAFLVANIFHTMVVSTKQQVHLANYLLELSLMDWSTSQHRPTVLAHAVVSLAHAIAKESTDDSMTFLTDVESLVSVERRLSHFSKMDHSRPVAAKLLDLFERASEEAVTIYDRYSTERELYVAFFGVNEPLKNALTNDTPVDQ